MRAFLHKANQILSAFCGWLMLAMMVFLMIDVVGRNLFLSIQGMTEMTVFVMIIAIYLGLARCEEKKEHVRLEIIVDLSPPSIRKVLIIFADLLAIVTIVIFIYALTQNTIHAYRLGEALSGTVEIRIWPVKVIMLIGLFFYGMQTFLNAIDEVRAMKKAKS